MTQLAAEKRPRGRESTIASHPKLALMEYVIFTCGVAAASREFNVSQPALYRHRAARLAHDPFYFVRLPPLESDEDIKRFAHIILGDFAPQSAAA